MKVLWISRDYPPKGGGQGIYTAVLHKRYLDRGVDSFVVTSKIREKDDRFEFRNVESLPLNSQNPLIFMVEALFYGLFKKGLEDTIIHGNGIDHFLLLLLSKRRKSSITTIHNTYVQRLESKPTLLFKLIYPMFIAIERQVVRMSDEVIAVSERTASYVRKYYDCDCVVVENGVDTKMYHKGDLGEDAFKFVFIGRYSSTKRPLETITLFMKFVDSYKGDKSISLDMYGVGELFDKSKALLKDNPGYPIHLHGYSDKISSVLTCSNCLLLLSESEGLPLVLLEAVSSGMTAILSENSTGDSKILQDQVNGYIVGNALEEKEVLDRMEKVIENYDRLSAESLRIKEGYDWSRVVDDNIAIYWKAVQE